MSHVIGGQSIPALLKYRLSHISHISYCEVLLTDKVDWVNYLDCKAFLTDIVDWANYLDCKAFLTDKAVWVNYLDCKAFLTDKVDWVNLTTLTMKRS